MNRFVAWTVGGAVVSIALVYSLIALRVLPSSSGSGIILWVIIVFTQIRANRAKPESSANPPKAGAELSNSSAYSAPVFALGMSIFYVGSAFGAGWASAALAGRIPPIRGQQGFIGLALMLIGIAILSALAVIASRAARRRSGTISSE